VPALRSGRASPRAFRGRRGHLLGIVSGYLGAGADQVVMRITTPGWRCRATFAIFLAAIVGPASSTLSSSSAWSLDTLRPRHQGRVLSLKQREFVRLAIVGRCSKRTIMWRHICPTSSNRPWCWATLMLGVVIVTELRCPSSGRRAAAQASLGPDDGRRQEGLMVGYWWLTVFPGICIMLMVLSANLLGDWLRVKLDPQSAPAVAAMPSQPLLSLEHLSTHYVSQQGSRVVPPSTT